MHDLHPDEPFDQVMVPLPDGGQAILVRHDGVVHAYRNACPHVGVGLDYGDGRCLHDGLLVCAMHGAIFEPDTGLCVGGPCHGDTLERLPISIGDGRIRIRTESAP